MIGTCITIAFVVRNAGFTKRGFVCSVVFDHVGAAESRVWRGSRELLGIERKREGECLIIGVFINIGIVANIGELAGSPGIAAVVFAHIGGVRAVGGADTAAFRNAAVELLHRDIE